jgi:hypothetical protein
MLHELLPKASCFGLLSAPNTPAHELIIKGAQAAASAIGGTIEVLTASTSDEIDIVFARLANEKHVHKLLVFSDPLFSLNAFNWPSWRRALQSLRSILSASRPKLAG